MGGSERSCSAIQAKAARGSIESGYPAASVFSRIRIHKTNSSEAGRYEQHYAQQPPFGFFSGAYLGEIAVCIPLFDPEARLEALKRRVANYREALRNAVVQDYLWQAELGLTAFAPKFAGRSGAYGTAA